MPHPETIVVLRENLIPMSISIHGSQVCTAELELSIRSGETLEVLRMGSNGV